MSAQVIRAETFLGRVGTPAECPRDRAFCAAMLKWKWRYRWRQAVEAGDYETLAYLARNYQMLDGL